MCTLSNDISFNCVGRIVSMFTLPLVPILIPNHIPTKCCVLCWCQILAQVCHLEKNWFCHNINMSLVMTLSTFHAALMGSLQSFSGQWSHQVKGTCSVYCTAYMLNCVWLVLSEGGMCWCCTWATDMRYRWTCITSLLSHTIALEMVCNILTFFARALWLPKGNMSLLEGKNKRCLRLQHDTTTLFLSESVVWPCIVAGVLISNCKCFYPNRAFTGFAAW